MVSLLIGQLALGVGPVIYIWLRPRPRLKRVLDTVVVLSITALVGFEIAPEAIAETGILAVAALAIGAVLPTLLEHLLHRTDAHVLENWTHRMTLAAAIAGLALHGTLDGAGLASADVASSGARTLAIAIIVHRLPVGLSIWWLLRPKFGSGIALVTLGGLVVTTFLGYFAGADLLTSLSSGAISGFQALVAGSLLHVIFFRRHLEHS